MKRIHMHQLASKASRLMRPGNFVPTSTVHVVGGLAFVALVVCISSRVSIAEASQVANKTQDEFVASKSTTTPKQNATAHVKTELCTKTKSSPQCQDTHTQAPSNSSKATLSTEHRIVSNPNSTSTKSSASSDLSVSDSISSSRFDEDSSSLSQDYANPTGDGDDEQSASSSEHKTIKEIRRLLGRSLAAESLDAHERRPLKAPRHSIDELLSAPRSQRKTSGAKAKRRNKTKKSKSSLDLSDLSSAVGGDQSGDLDADMVGDAETVIQHLQGIANVINGPSSSAGPDESGGSGAGDQDEAGASGGQQQEAAESSSSGHTDDDDSDQGERSKLRRLVSSNGRPLARQLRRFKQSLSTRRKQLEQVKKIFGVELALGANKDGHQTLVGRPDKKRKPSAEQHEDEFESVDVNESPAGKTRSKAFKSSKMGQLREYLVQNPDVLSQLMTELNVDAGEQAKSTLVGADDPDVGELAASAVGRSSYLSKKQMKQVESMYPETFALPMPNKRRVSSRTESLHFELAKGRRSSSNLSPIVDRTALPAAKSKARRRETLIMESLRDRQLMNLARLEQAIADRQQPAGFANRSDSALDELGAFGSRLASLPGRQLDELSARDANSALYARHSQLDDGSSSRIRGSNLLGATRERRELPNQLDFAHQDHAGASFGPQQSAGQQLIGRPLLSRFRDWREVSQSELGSPLHRMDGPLIEGWGSTAVAPFTWIPYDLTTGGSSYSVSNRLRPDSAKRQAPQPGDALATRAAHQEAQSQSQVSAQHQPQPQTTQEQQPQPRGQRQQQPQTQVRAQQARVSTKSELDGGKFMTRTNQEEPQQTNKANEGSRGERSSELASKSAQEASEQDAERAGLPVDYFSAYKGADSRDWPDYERPSSSEPSGRGDEGGAMWA